MIQRMEIDMKCEHKSLENIHCFKCDKTHHEIVNDLKNHIKFLVERLDERPDPPEKEGN